MRGLLSPSKKEKNKLSRVSFNNAVKLILPQIINNQPESVYNILNNYLYAFSKIIPQKFDSKLLLTNPTLFTSIILLFPKASIKVKDKFSGDYSIDKFYEVIEPLKTSVKPTTFQKPGSSYRKIYNVFVTAFDRIDLTF